MSRSSNPASRQAVTALPSKSSLPIRRLMPIFQMVAALTVISFSPSSIATLAAAARSGSRHCHQRKIFVSSNRRTDQGSTPKALRNSSGNGPSKSGEIHLIFIAPEGLRGPLFAAGTGPSFANGLPCLAMTISSPEAARSTSDESWSFASERLNTLVMGIWPTWPDSTIGILARSNGPLDQQLLDLGDRLRRVEALRTGLGAVHDGVAAVEAERVLEIIEPLALGLVAAVGQPAIGLQQDRRAEVALALPPVGRAGGRAAEAQDALPQAVELGALLGRLQALASRRLGGRFQPRLDRGKLRVRHREIRHQVLDHRHMRQRVDLDVALHVVDVLGTGERVGAVDVHRARAAHALAAGAAEGQRAVDLVLDLDQRVQDHRPAGREIDLVGVEARVLPVVRRPAVDLEGPDPGGAGGRLVGVADANLGVGGQGELGHRSFLDISTRGPSAGRTARRCSSAGG